MEVTELARRLREVLDRRADVRFAILYGSSVSRGPEAARDIDIAVALTAPTSLMALGALACDLEAVAGKPVDLVDVDDATTLLRWEIVRGGMALTERDPGALADFKARVPLEYADLRPYLDREADGLRRALQGD